LIGWHDLPSFRVRVFFSEQLMLIGEKGLQPPLNITPGKSRFKSHSRNKPTRHSINAELSCDRRHWAQLTARALTA
jgi:hypothetical protein